MYSKPGKASKGTVQVEDFQGRLRLRFRFNGERKSLALGMPNTQDNWKAAEQKARQIELDIISGNFDPTLKKYRNQSHLTVVESIKPKTAYKLDQLWEKYTRSKWKSASPSTRRMYGWVERHIKRLPSQAVEDSTQIKEFVDRKLEPGVAKRLYMHLSACCNYGLDNGYVESNPFSGQASKVKLPKSQADEEDINPFTKEERDLIIQAFKSNRYYKRYASLVEFLFFTGCRPSEAVALLWGDIQNGFINFNKACVMNEKNEYEVKQGTKTESKRKLRINKQLQNILDSIRPESAKAIDLVFPSPDGIYIDMHNFRNRAWAKTLEQLGIEYRKPYQTRHTFITLCLESGIDAKDVSKWVGNSPEVIYRHYASNKRDLSVPEL